jgi:hypothetical protein
MEQYKGICATGKFPDFRKEILKVFLHPPPPSERESFERIVEFTIPKVSLLSIHKMRL